MHLTFTSESSKNKLDEYNDWVLQLIKEQKFPFIKCF